MLHLCSEKNGSNVFLSFLNEQVLTTLHVMETVNIHHGHLKPDIFATRKRDGHAPTDPFIVTYLLNGHFCH